MDMNVKRLLIKKLLNDLRADEKGEGDLNNYSTPVLMKCFKAGWIKAVACERPYKNIRLTNAGWKYAESFDVTSDRLDRQR